MGRKSFQNEFDAVGLRTHEASLGKDVQTTLGQQVCSVELSERGSNYFFFRDLMVYLESRCRRHWNCMALSSDASMTGRSCLRWGHIRTITTVRANARDHAFQAALLEPVDAYAEYLRSPQKDAPNEFPKSLLSAGI